MNMNWQPSSVTNSSKIALPAWTFAQTSIFRSSDILSRHSPANINILFILELLMLCMIYIHTHMYTYIYITICIYIYVYLFTCESTMPPGPKPLEGSGNASLWTYKRLEIMEARNWKLSDSLMAIVAVHSICNVSICWSLGDVENLMVFLQTETL